MPTWHISNHMLLIALNATAATGTHDIRRTPGVLKTTWRAITQPRSLLTCQLLPGTVMQHLGQEFSHAPLSFTQRPLASCSRRPIGPLQPVRPCRQTTQPRRSMSLEEAQTAPAHKAPLSRVQHDPQGQCSAGNQTSPSLRLSTMPDPEAPTYVVSSPPSAPMAPATTKRDIPAF